MDLFGKVVRRERGESGDLIDSAQRFFEDQLKPSVMEIAGTAGGEHGPRVNYIDRGIDSGIKISRLRRLLSTRAKGVVGPFVKPCERTMHNQGSPLLRLDNPRLENSPTGVYVVVHKNSGVDNNWRFTAATAEAALAPQFYGRQVYKFSSELGFFGMDTEAILAVLIQQNGADAQIVRDVRRLVELAGSIVGKRVDPGFESTTLDELALLSARIGETARAVLLDLG